MQNKLSKKQTKTVKNMKKHNILWIPGLLCTERLFNYQINNLDDIANHEVFVIKTYDEIKKAANYILENSEFDNFSIVGFSMGGYIALEILKQDPKRVKNLCIVNSSHKVDSDARKQTRLKSIEAAQKGKFIGMGDSLFSSMVYDKTKTDVKDAVNQMALEISVDSFINQQKLILSRTDSSKALQDFEGKSLFIAGKRDNITPMQLHYEMKELSKKGSIAVVEESGHLSPLEQPQAVSSVIRYFFENQ